jgi:hypothetical protein
MPEHEGRAVFRNISEELETSLIEKVNTSL